MKASTVGVYVRTTVLTPKYDRYEAELLAFCEQQGWDNILIYRDRVGDRIAQSGFDAFERALKLGKVDADAIGQLVRQQEEDDQHNRDGFRELIGDAQRGKVETIVVHDAGQLGRNKMEVFRSLEALTHAGARLVIPGIGEIGGDTPLFGAGPIDCPDTFGMSSLGSRGF